MRRDETGDPWNEHPSRCWEDNEVPVHNLASFLTRCAGEKWQIPRVRSRGEARRMCRPFEFRNRASRSC